MSKQGLDPKLGSTCIFPPMRKRRRSRPGLETGDEQIAFPRRHGRGRAGAVPRRNPAGSGRRQQGSATPAYRMAAPATRTRCGTAWRRDAPRLPGLVQAHQRRATTRGVQARPAAARRTRREHRSWSAACTCSAATAWSRSCARRATRSSGSARRAHRSSDLARVGRREGSDVAASRALQAESMSCNHAAIAVRSASIPRGPGNG